MLSADYINVFLRTALQNHIISRDSWLVFYKGFLPRTLGSTLLLPKSEVCLVFYWLRTTGAHKRQVRSLIPAHPLHAEADWDYNSGSFSGFELLLGFWGTGGNGDTGGGVQRRR